MPSLITNDYLRIAKTFLYLEKQGDDRSICDFSDIEQERIGSLPRKYRNFILRGLDSQKNLEEDVARNTSEWKKMFRLLHTGSYHQYQNLQRVTDKVRNDLRLETFYSKIEAAIKRDDFTEALRLYGTRPGEMIKNFATGCTQVLNKSLIEIIKNYTPNYIIMHDSWITRVCYAIGGNVIIDDNSYIMYRQHQGNVLGYQDEGFQKLKKQFKIAFLNKECMRVNIAKELKNGYEKLLTPSAKEVVNNLILYPHDKKSKKWLLQNKNFRTKDSKINRKMKLSIYLNRF